MTAIVHSEAPPSSSDDRGLSSARLVFRFGIGLVELAGTRLVQALRIVSAVEDMRAPALSTTAAELEPPAAPTARHVVIGAFVSTPEAIASVLVSLGPARVSASRLARRGRRALSRVPGSSAVARRWRRLQVDAFQRVLRYAALGRAEAEAGRKLAQAFVAEASETAVARVADSPELKRVISDQSQGLAATAVNQLRERSARADGVAESVTRRLFGRSRSAGKP